MNLTELLHTIPTTYNALAESALPARSGEPPQSSDPRAKPAPGRLEVMEHRHELVRGLRWWVDAVRDPDDTRRVAASDVRWLCGYIAGHVDRMAAEDRDELTANLRTWRHKAWKIIDPTPLEAGEVFALPAEAYRQRVPKSVAAKALRVSVDTIERRSGRVPGDVLLADVAPKCGACGQVYGFCDHTRCELCGLVVGQCAHSRNALRA